MTESWHDVANKRADRVRELEAELDRTHACAMGRCLCPHDSIIIELEARAEKAEKAFDEERTHCTKMMAKATDKLEKLIEANKKAEARVAELEAEIRLCRETPVVGDYPEVHITKAEAREREAD